ALASGHFDTAVLFPNSFAAALSVSRARIAERWGYGTDWRGRLLTRAVPKVAGLLHQAAYYQTLVAGLGIATGPRYARVHVDREGRDSAPAQPARELLAGSGIDVDQPFVVFAPGAAYGRAKQWLPEHFAELATLLVRDQGWPVALVGTTADRAVCDEIGRDAHAAGADRSRLVSLAGQTELPTLAGVLALSRAVVSNDSGVMHLAGALGVKVVAIFGASNEDRTAPLVPGPDSPAPAIVTHDVFCRPCMLRECPIDHRCMRGVSARRVYEILTSGPPSLVDSVTGLPSSPRLPPSLMLRRAAVALAEAGRRSDVAFAQAGRRGGLVE
ncbi:MAG: lipopolysaccharide heptosyltransferase II, partial [Vicinamibacterales bacterium]